MIEIEKKFKITEEEYHELKDKLFDSEEYQNVDFHKETNILYTHNEINFENRLIRLRKYEDGGNYLTYKEPISNEDGLKKQLEIETSIGNKGESILEKLGFYPSLVYEKERYDWYKLDIMISLDRLPFGYFVELEGAEEGILIIEEELGLKDKVELKSYPALTEEHLQNMKLIDVRFENV